MSNKLLDDLNEEQKAAVINLKVPIRILAGAGSGKTKVLTRKIAYLIEIAKVDPWKIMALTFTNKAANEMKQRVQSLLHNHDLSNKIQISTFHSFCAKFLRIEIENLKGYNKDFVILDSTDQIDVLKEIYQKSEISSTNFSYFSMLEYISHKKNKQIESSQAIEDAIEELEKTKANVYNEYQKILNNSKALDFDDLLIFTRNILLNNKPILEKWQKRFDYFLVDEFQDTSEIQYNIISLISQNENITIVGDPDQTIYTWRGADISFINEFDQKNKKTLTITLNKNYRSTKKILEAANRLILNNPNRIPKNLITENDEGENISFYHGLSSDSETQWVISKINELKKKKVQLKDIAILYRSNYYSRLIETALINETIAYKTLGGQRFYERSEIKDSLSFLRSIWKPNDISLKKIINTPSRKIGERTVQKLVEFAIEKNLSLWDSWMKYFNEIKIPNESKHNLFNFINLLRKYNSLLARKYPIYKVLEEFLDEVGYTKILEQDDNQTNSTRLENVKELIKSISIWEKNNLDKNLDDYFEEISLISLNDDIDNINYISLMTVHAAKGLEFKNVFIIGMNEDVFPSYKSISDDHDEDKLEEERRLAYVAITRAKERLFVSCGNGSQFDNGKSKPPSRFIKEMGLKIDKKIINSAEALLESSLSKKDRSFSPGDLVMHTNFGEGTVLDINGDTIIISFKNKDIGVKQLLKKHKALERLIK